MRKNVITWLLLLALPIVSYCQYVVKGSVMDKETSEKLPGANVLIEGTFIGTTTDSEGNFKFYKLKKGNYNVVVSFIGYNTFKQTVEINNDLELEVKLERSTILQETVIITATNVADKYPSTFKNVNSKDLNNINMGKDLPFILNNTPSLVSTSDAGNGIGYTNLRIRGSDITRINVTMNGIPMNDPESQVLFFVDLPDIFSSVDNFQIVRGVGTSVNGASAFGASINIQSQKLIPNPYCEINNSYGSFNSFKNNIRFGTGLLNNKWSFDGRFSNLSSDGYIDRAYSKLNSYFLSGAYYGNNSMIKINIFSGMEWRSAGFIKNKQDIQSIYLFQPDRQL
jgi:iron complex outermembrane receptor protein